MSFEDLVVLFKSPRGVLSTRGFGSGLLASMGSVDDWRPGGDGRSAFSEMWMLLTGAKGERQERSEVRKIAYTELHGEASWGTRAHPRRSVMRLPCVVEPCPPASVVTPAAFGASPAIPGWFLEPPLNSRRSRPATRSAGVKTHFSSALLIWLSLNLSFCRSVPFPESPSLRGFGRPPPDEFRSH